MKPKFLRSFMILAALALPAASAGAQTAAKAMPARINVYQYAIDNPVNDAALRSAPTIGASVPAAVELTPCADEATYSYFYYNGLPVIVEQSTRSVVRIGQ